VEKPDGLDPSWIARLFAKFQARYGNKWTSSLPTADIQLLAVREWSAGLAGYTGAEINQGLEMWQDSWPPSVHEFQSACRPQHKAACHQPFPETPKPKKKMTRSLAEFLRNYRAESGESEPPD